MIKILKYGQVPNEEVFARVAPTVDVAAVVSDIIANVRAKGDRAVLEYNLKFDKAELTSLLVSQEDSSLPVFDTTYIHAEKAAMYALAKQ